MAETSADQQAAIHQEIARRLADGTFGLACTGMVEGTCVEADPNNPYGWCDACLLRSVGPSPGVWRDITSAPKDGTVILRPHRIWGAMDVRRITEADAARVSVLAEGIPWRWLNGDYTTAWTETAFLPFWMPIPENPKAAPTGEASLPAPTLDEKE